MAAETGTVGLFRTIGALAKQADAQIKDTPVSVSGGRVPGGIKNGIAELRFVGFGAYQEGDNKGKLFFRASGVVLHPEATQDGLPIIGLITQIGPEPLCDTPKKSMGRKTFLDHYKWVRDQIAVLGRFDPVKVNADTMESLCTFLMGMRPRPKFRFRTWDPPVDEARVRMAEAQGQTIEPMTVNIWEGWVDWTPPTRIGMKEVSAPIVTQGNGTPPPPVGPADTADQFDDGQVTSAEETPSTGRDGLGSTGADEVVPTPSSQGETDLDALVAVALEDEKARATLKTIAIGLGIPEETVDNADEWKDVAEMIRLASVKKEEPVKEKKPATKGGSAPPKVGETTRYKVVDPTTGKPVKSKATKGELPPVDCEVIKVSVKNQTADLQNLATQEVYKGIKWDRLID